MRINSVYQMSVDSINEIEVEVPKELVELMVGYYRGSGELAQDPTTRQEHLELMRISFFEIFERYTQGWVSGYSELSRASGHIYNGRE